MPVIDKEIENIEEFQNILNAANISNQIVILKFHAEWCKPCKMIKNIVNECIDNMHENIIFYNIDIDENIDIYVKLKHKKMVKGIPALLAWYPNNKDIYNEWFVIDDSVSSSNNNDIKLFFEKCNDKQKTFILAPI